eukprot:TRINITY_DN27248_c0_g1_i2.p1 TRINITY_DN27248_c0_g1~~TRINITY_DN27248_c0_g1_i2.p1  ORF type:complete len:307 (+),score=47.00 TRINITY_DN27248_c0_g1_i2:74-922(+)
MAIWRGSMRRGAAALMHLILANGRGRGGATGDPRERFLSQAPPTWPLPLGVNALEAMEFPEAWPWQTEDLRREDESDDKLFYAEPRLVAHIDKNAIRGLTRWYAENLPQSSDTAILDFCSSWISHFPEKLAAKRVVGLGMNSIELGKNKMLTEYVQQDLNGNPKFPFDDGTFDAVVNAVSVDYLNKPREIFEDLRRIARPGALVAMSFSNRMFFTKAIRRWTKASEFQRLLICGSYFHFAGFKGVRAERVDEGRGDPMWVVFARAPGNAAADGIRASGEGEL